MLTGKWNAGILTQDEVTSWIYRQAEAKKLTHEEIKHIGMCMHHIYLWHMKKGELGHFLSAIVKNDFVEVCKMADDTNRKVLPLYVYFLYNVAPMSWRKGRAVKVD